jgi:hypothetical protein
VALPHDFLQQALHGFDSVHQVIQFGQLSPGKRAPALGSSRDVAESEEELPNLIQRETDLARPLDDGEAIQHGVVIASLPADPFAGKKDPDPFVKADGGGPKPNLSRDLGDRE